METETSQMEGVIMPHEYDKVDLTISDDSDDEIVLVQPSIEEMDIFEPKPIYSNKDIFRYYYGTEDLTEVYKVTPINVPTNKKESACKRPRQFSIRCCKCNQYFANHIFMRHILEHFHMEYGLLDALLTPQAPEVDCTIFTDFQIPHVTDIRCEICFLVFISPIDLAQHIRIKHSLHDMPYHCHACGLYRTSFHSQLLKHFGTHHTDTNGIICLICCEFFLLSPESIQSNDSSKETVLDATSYVRHVEKHIIKKQFICDRCMLRFTSKSDLMFHRTVEHPSLRRQITSVNDNNSITVANNKARQPTVTSSNNVQLNGIDGKKSLNVANEPINLAKIEIRTFPLNPLLCVECREPVGDFAQHFQNHHKCRQCGYTTRCTPQYRRHLRNSNHTNGSTAAVATNGSGMAGTLLDLECGSLDLDVNIDNYLVCRGRDGDFCGYTTAHGNKMAKHISCCRRSDCCVVRSRLEDAFINCTTSFSASRNWQQQPQQHQKHKLDEKMSYLDYVKCLRLERI